MDLAINISLDTVIESIPHHELCTAIAEIMEELPQSDMQEVIERVADQCTSWETFHKAIEGVLESNGELSNFLARHEE